MGYFLQSGDVFHPAPSKDALLDGLPAGTYVLEETMQGWVYKRGESFTRLPELYGDLEEKADRIFRSFLEREGNTGVLLSGVKGSGKSLLSRIVSKNAASNHQMPTILINKAIAGNVLGDMLGQLKSPAVVIFDEFEKVYNDYRLQESILGVLDGMHRSRHLFIVTVNDFYGMGNFLKNRPGRLYYHFKFGGLDPEFIEEYCLKNLENKEWIEDVKTVSHIFSSFNFDMLQAIVEETNRFNENPREAVEHLNISPGDGEESYKLTVTTLADENVPLYHDTTNVNPFSPRGIMLEVDDIPTENLPGDVCSDERITFSSKNLKKLDISTGTFNFETERFKIMMKRDTTPALPVWSSLL